jgi:hypothetical protein
MSYAYSAPRAFAPDGTLAENRMRRYGAPYGGYNSYWRRPYGYGRNLYVDEGRWGRWGRGRGLYSPGRFMSPYTRSYNRFGGGYRGWGDNYYGGGYGMGGGYGYGMVSVLLSNTRIAISRGKCMVLNKRWFVSFVASFLRVCVHPGLPSPLPPLWHGLRRIQPCPLHGSMVITAVPTT